MAVKISRRMGNIFALVLLCLGSSVFADVLSNSRQTNFYFLPNIEELRAGKIENFFQVFDADGTLKIDDSGTQPVPLETLLPLDVDRVLEHARNDGKKIYIMLIKVAYVIKKDFLFIKKNVLNPAFWQAVQPKLNASYDFTKASDSKTTAYFHLKGSGFLPSADLKLTLYSDPHPDIHVVMNFDTDLGTPSFVVSERYTNFGRVFGSDTNLENNVVNKYYSTRAGETMVVSYSLVYPRRLLPGILGGIKGMHKNGIEAFSDLILAIERQ